MAASDIFRMQSLVVLLWKGGSKDLPCVNMVLMAKWNPHAFVFLWSKMKILRTCRLLFHLKGSEFCWEFNIVSKWKNNSECLENNSSFCYSKQKLIRATLGMIIILVWKCILHRRTLKYMSYFTVYNEFLIDIEVVTGGVL